MTGVGVEIAKNVILAGVAKVVIHDPTPARWTDLSSQFYLTEADVQAQRPRAEACLPRLRELNSYVEVLAATEPLTPALIEKYCFGCVVIADPLAHSFIELCLLNEFCRHQHRPITFLMACSAGPVAFAFSDFGPIHTVEDQDGLPAAQGTVSMISNDAKCIVTLAEESTAAGMPFQTGDPIHFTEVRGCESLNTGRYRVGETTKITFVLEEGNEVEGFHPVDGRTLGAHVYGSGQVVAHKVPLRMSMSSLSDSVVAPFRCPKLGDLPQQLLEVDFRKMGLNRPGTLHLFVRALYAYTQRFGGQLPRPANPEDAEKLVECARTINEAAKRANAALPTTWEPVAREFCLESFDEAAPLLRRLAMHVQGNLCPMAAFLGGVVAQEVMKVTGKFTPLHQWLHFDIAEILPETMGEPAQYLPVGNRYDGQRMVFGAETQKKLGALKPFLVGAGALGCEFAKGFAMMGVGLEAEGGLVTMTDMDTIEKSNLNRQFLFRPRDIGSHKSTAAARAMREMNSGLQITCHTSAVGEDTENVFTDEAFWPAIDVAVNALDNVAARTYTDGKCAAHRKPLLESGTTGTMANVQVVLPGKTECYSDSTDFAEGVGVPMCTIRNFPNLIMHCIEWSVSEETIGSYNKLFKLNISVLKDFAKDPAKWLAELPSRMNISEQREALELVHEAVADAPFTFEKCIAWGRIKFQQFFHDQIVQLLTNFPADAVDTTTGQPFWTGVKRMPVPMIFDPTNVLHMQFVHCAANLRAHALGVPQHRINSQADYEYFCQVLSRVQVPVYVPKKVAAAPAEGEKKDKADAPQYTPEEEEALVARLRDSLPRAAIDQAHVHPEKFEKDDDANFHVDYCTACANLRGANYHIEPTDRMAVKTAAGRIIPALATTTAMVTGLVLNQLYLLVQGCQDIAKYTNGSINLATHVWGFAEPLPPRTVEQSTEFRTQIAQYKLEEAEYKKAGGSFKWSVRAVPPKHTRHDVIRMHGDVTLGEVINHFQDQLHLSVQMVTAGKGMFYDMTNPAHKDRLRMRLSEIHQHLFHEPPTKKTMTLSLSASDPAQPDDVDDETIFTPDVVVVLH
eukprot:GAFH01000746.1.p1 GENE.GAFH01000746.1~~GAFH01000746.1.p1  ORF type:complete len:1128 (-),score=556.06 GAFH01000746.1:67-3294(-)